MGDMTSDRKLWVYVEAFLIPIALNNLYCEHFYHKNYQNMLANFVLDKVDELCSSQQNGDQDEIEEMRILKQKLEE